MRALPSRYTVQPTAVTPLNILVVEDYPAIRQRVCRELERQPALRVVAVSDGISAVESAAKLRPDLILLDIGLPGIDGLSAARRIRQLSPASRIVFLTQESSAHVVHEALTLGAHGYLHKMQTTYLLPTVEAILAGDSSGADRGHRAHFYSNEGSLLENGELYLASAIVDGRGAIAVVTGTHRPQLHEGLERLGIDVERAVEQGTFVFVDADEAVAAILSKGARQCQPALARTVASAAAAAPRPQSRVAVFGETASMLCAAGHADAAMELEQVGAEMVRSMAVDILCTYPLPPNDDAAFKAVCAHHGALAIC